MKLEDLRELHYITHIDNLSSIFQYGISCHKDAKQYSHKSIADESVQVKRENKSVPNGKPLHSYANLYINARNTMLFRNCREYSCESICVLRIDKSVLFLAEVVIADGNAASDYTKFQPSPSGIEMVDENLVFARYWTDEDEIVQWEKRRVICAEVLVPRKISPQYIKGIYVCSEKAAQQVRQENSNTDIAVNSDLFFKDG